MRIRLKDGSGLGRTTVISVVSIFLSAAMFLVNGTRTATLFAPYLQLQEVYETQHFKPPPPSVQPASNQSSMLQNLLYLYDTLPTDTSPQAPPPFRELSHAFPRRKEVPDNAITLITQMSVTKFPRLLNLLERWNGPISCAVHLPDRDSIQELHELIQTQNQTFHDFVTIHVLLEAPTQNHDYPINQLRNLAFFHIETEFFFFSDVDFMTRVDGHAHLMKSLGSKRRRGKQTFSTLYVLPAFEVFGDTTDHRRTNKDKSSPVTSLDDVPKTKQDVLEMLPTGKIQPFHIDYWPKGHRLSNYTKWYNCSKGETYPVPYKWYYEPYVVGSRHGIPKFNERLRGFGINKVGWLAEAHLVGYKFEVLCDDFVVHMHHAGRKGRRPTKHMKDVQWYKTQFLRGRYNFSV